MAILMAPADRRSRSIAAGQARSIGRVYEARVDLYAHRQPLRSKNFARYDLAVQTAAKAAAGSTR